MVRYPYNRGRYTHGIIPVVSPLTSSMGRLWINSGSIPIFLLFILPIFPLRGRGVCALVSRAYWNTLGVFQ